MASNANTTADNHTPPAGRRPGHVPVIDSRLLIGAAGEVRIDHGGEVYRLRVTRNGKLILNK